MKPLVSFELARAITPSAESFYDRPPRQGRIRMRLAAWMAGRAVNLSRGRLVVVPERRASQQAS
jgi:hypothetical protein